MRNAVEYALAGGLPAVIALGLTAGAALAAPAPRAPAALVLPAVPERVAGPTVTLVCGPESADARPVPGVVCVRADTVDGRGGNTPDASAGAGADEGAGTGAEVFAF